MTPEDIKRLYYYERQFLRTQDFQDEQSYHIEMRRRHLIAEHTWGIIAGLEITQDATSKVWAVQPGMAVDGYGREIVVFQAEPLNLTAIADQLSGQGLPALLKIWIAYQTELANPPAAGYEVCNGQNQYTRVRESFQLVYKKLVFDDGIRQWPHAFQDLPDDPQTAFWPVYLGTITWGADPTNPTQNIILNAQPVDPIDKKARHYVGVVAAEVIAPDNTLLIRGKNNLDPPTTPPKPDYNDVDAKVSGTLQVTNYLTVGPFAGTTSVGGIDVAGKIDATGKGAALGFVNRSLTSWPSPPQPGNRYAWYNPDGTARLCTDSNSKSVDIITCTSTGNVGIGVSNPQQNLSLNSSLNVDQANVNAGQLNPGISFGSVSGEGIASRRATGNNQFGLDFYTNSKARLSITQSGSVGIGTLTPSPLLMLDVQGDFGRDSGATTVHLWSSRIGDTGGGILFLNSAGGTIALNGNVGIGTGIAPVSARLELTQPDLGTVDLFPFTGAAADFRYDGGTDHSYWFVNTAKNFGETRFRWDDGTSSLNLLVINNNGNVGIGTSTPNLKLDIQGDFGRTDGAATLHLWGSQIGDTGNSILFLKSVTSGTILLDTTGGVNTPESDTIHLKSPQIIQEGTVIQRSSKELKQNIVELSSQESVELLNQLNSVKFNYKADPKQKLCLGFIAEEIPDAIANSDRKGFAPTDILALLTKVVQEQHKAIAALTAKVNQLETQLK